MRQSEFETRVHMNVTAEEYSHIEEVYPKGRYSHQDTTRNWLPVVRYKLLIPGLTAEEFKKKKVDLVPLGDFLKEWFVPFEVRCEIDVKEHSQPQNPDGRLTLNYNTELNQ